MAQFFSPWANTAFRLAILAIVLALGFTLLAGFIVASSSYETRQDVPREQPVPFSHEHHAGGLGIDCRYCHTTVEISSSANVPATKICMNCHSELWAGSPMLDPVRESFRTGQSIAWTRVHDLPDFVYFNHSIHVNKGIGCSSCHGRVDRMPLTWQAASLRMKWCLDCHRNPEQFVRPEDRVFDMSYQPPPDQLAIGKKLVNEYHIQSLTSCSVCHR